MTMSWLFAQIRTFRAMRKTYFFEAREEIAHKNLELLRMLSVVVFCLNLILLLITPFLITGWRISGLYWLFLILSGAMALSSHFFLEKISMKPRAVMGCCLVFEVVVIGCCMMIDVFPYPKSISTFMAPLLVIAPAMFILPLFMHVSLLSGLYILYAFLEMHVKPFRNAQIDLFSGLIGLLFGILVAFTITNFRVREGIAKNQYKRLSTMDQLTGLYNRATIVDLMTKAFATQSDEPEKVFVLIDLDDFKRVNDQWGHQTGDFVLERVGAILRECFGKGDAIGRSGGDEFMILVARKLSRHDLVLLLDDVEARVIGILAERGEQVSCSIGVIIWDGISTFSEMFRYADEALYSAKRNGRSCIVVEKASDRRTDEAEQKPTLFSL